MRIVNEKMRMLSRIHWRVRLLDVIFFFRVDCGGFCRDVAVEFVSVLDRDLVNLSLRFFFEFASLITDVGGGGK